MPSKDELIGLPSIAMPPTDPLEHYLLDHENDLHMHERNEIDKVFFEQRPLLKHNLPIETLGGPPPPKGVATRPQTVQSLCSGVIPGSVMLTPHST